MANAQRHSGTGGPNNRAASLAARSIERRSKRTGVWAPWDRHPIPLGFGSGGWCNDIREAYANGLYVVLVRRLPTGVIHCAIRTASNLEPPWRDLQRIKNELFGPERFAVQVCPPEARLVDAADMYHLWIMPEGHEPGFGLSDEEAA